MTLNELSNFVRIAELQSLSKAAAVIRIAQPALSRQLRRLEAELGAPLLVRHSWGVSLTQAGEVLLQRARRVLLEAEGVRDAVQALGAEPAGRVAIGVPTSLATVLLPELAVALRAKHPKLRPHFVDGFSGVLHSRTISGDLDLAVLYHDRAIGPLSTSALLDEDLVLVGPADVHATPGTTAAMLAHRPLILPARPNRLRLIVDAALGENGDRAPLFEVDSLPAIIALVSRGAGWTVLPYSSVVEETARGELRVWDLDAPQLSRALLLVQPAGRHPTPAVAAVAEELRDLVARLAPRLRWRIPAAP